MKTKVVDAGGSQGKMTYREAAIEALKERGPLHYRDLTNAILQAGLVDTAGVTPEASVNARITVEIRRAGKKSAFIRIRPGVFGLRGLHEPRAHSTTVPGTHVGDENETATDDTNLRVRVPFFPLYSELRHLLRVWPGRSRHQVTGLQATINNLRGTPQNAVDWTHPAVWIPERLEGEDHELAQAIWDRSKRTVNPRYIYGHWLLAQRYGLLREDSEGFLQFTDVGREFLEQSGGEVESTVDEAEGLIKLLSIVADNGPARAGELVGEWRDYLARRSPFRAESTVQDTMRRRLNNLLARRLIERKSSLYSATPDGLAYLEKTGDDDSVGGSSDNQVWALVRQQENTVRESLRELLHDMDPLAFEHLVRRLLEEMGYENVEVTARSNDGGVDVVGNIEVGITSVREVVQVKRHRRTIQRRDLDALRGSLYRFNAVRGTIFTTSWFSKGTRDAAFAKGVAPITLVDGDKLVDLLIEHSLGVRKRPIELLEVDAEAIAAIDTDS